MRVFGRQIALSVSDKSELPTEFRLFMPGWNETENGRYLFDKKAADSVMKAFEEHGVDRMIDLEHLSLDTEGRHFDPDARGWCKLELRGDPKSPELWATNVSWTPDGAERLAEKRQRYISPAFQIDPKTKRVLAVQNIAITAMPATHDTPALVAAAARNSMKIRKPKQTVTVTLSDGESEGESADTSGALKFSPELISALGEALGKPDATVEDVIAMMRALLKGVSGDGNEAAPAAAVDPDQAQEAEEMRSTRSVLLSTTGKRTTNEALSVIDLWRKSHEQIETARAKNEADRANLEATERRGLVVEMVKLGVETPATAWADDTATKPAEPWASMKLDALRSRVEKLRGRGKTAAMTSVQPPASSEQTGASTSGDEDLEESELAMLRRAAAKKGAPDLATLTASYVAKRQEIRDRSPVGIKKAGG